MLTQFSNQTSIDTYTAAYVTHPYGISPRQEYLLEFTSEYGISEDVHPKLPGPEDRIVDFPEDFSGWTKEYFPPPWTGAHMLRRMRCQQRTPTLDMDLFNLISAPNPSKVKTGLHPRAAHEVPLLTATASRVIDMKDPNATTESSGTPSAIKKSLPDFDNENPASPMTKEVREEEVAALKPRMSKKRGRKGNDGADVNAPPRVLGKIMRLTATTPEAKHDPIPTGNMATVEVQDMRSTESAGLGKSTSSSSMVGSPGEIYQPGWGVTNSFHLDTQDACQDVVDHIVPSRYFSELRHMPNIEFLSQYNKNLAQQVAIGSQLRLHFEQETSDLKTLLDAKTDMKKAAETKNADLTKELESLRSQFSELQVSHDQLTQQVSTLQAQVTGEEKIKAAFEEFKKYKDDRVEKHCAEIDARLDALSTDFDKELYPHMLTAIAGRRWVIGHDLRLAVMKCGESTELRQAYDLEAETKYVAALHALMDLKYPMVDQLELLKDALIDVVMASLHLESDFGQEAPQWIRELRPSSSQLKIPVYLKVRDPKDPWAFKEEILLANAIAANISHNEKKKKCRVVCRTYGVGSAHHARSDGVLVSVPTVALQGLAILLADAAIQTKTSKDGASPRICTCGVSCAPWESSRMHITS
nr:hypothetical protein [Tanacetum cinerariifolium]